MTFCVVKFDHDTFGRLHLSDHKGYLGTAPGSSARSQSIKRIDDIAQGTSERLQASRDVAASEKDIAVFTSSEDGTASDNNVVMISGGPGAAIMLGHYHEAHYQSLDLQRDGQLECIQEQANSAESTSTKLDVFQDICNDNRQLDDIVVSIGPYRVSKLDILTIAPRLPKETEDQMRDKIEKEMRWTVGWVNDQIINAFLYVLCQGRECKERNVALSTQVIEGWRNFKSGRSHRVALLRKVMN
ncbi:uncharacterized protein LOC124266462 [Haliotis rubra]|uniref:uncharacterized protein LOC124266462 n=1 Tax=Haliotis rubra TaxID=36100 RepID=UPI001EE5A55E|nr:uncharacterized protein LOC124266462 [Haliotis rubra]